MAGPLHRAPDWRSTHDPPHTQMVGGRSDGRRTVVVNRDRDPTGVSGLPDARQHLPTLLLRSVGRAISGGYARAVGSVRTGTAPAKDAPDRVRPVCGRMTRGAGSWETRGVQL